MPDAADGWLSRPSLLHKRPVGGGVDHWWQERWVGLNYVTGDREQRFLLALDMRDWLPADHLCWFVIDVVDQLDLGAFHRSYRADGHGRAAYDPAVMVAILLYAYCTGVRSSRQIQRRCVEQVDYRVLAVGLAPDHVTLARFRARHADALAGVFVDSLRLCAEAGLVALGAIAVDGTKIAANASIDRNRTSEELPQQITAILDEAAATDAAEDVASTRDGDSELEPPMDPAVRRAKLAAARSDSRPHERGSRSSPRTAPPGSKRAPRSSTPPARRKDSRHAGSGPEHAMRHPIRERPRT